MSRAVTAVSHDTFVNARPVAAANVRVNAQQIQQAQVQRNFTVAPVRGSVVGAPEPVATAKPPAPVMQRQVVAKTPPPPQPHFGRNEHAGIVHAAGPRTDNANYACAATGAGSPGLPAIHAARAATADAAVLRPAAHNSSNSKRNRSRNSRAPRARAK